VVLAVVTEEYNMKQAPKLEFIMTEAKILDETVVDEKTGDKVLRAEVKWQQAAKINVNNRRYRRTILEREIEKLLPSVKAKEVYGCSYHPKDGIGDTHEVTHLWENIWMNDDGECLGVVKVLPTHRGKDIQVIMHHGRIGMSSRGVGTTTMTTDMVENEKKTFEDVNDDFRLKVPGDFVLYPSVPDAGVRQLMESRLECVDDSESVKENKEMEIKNKDELKAAYSELCKQLAEDAAAEARATMDADIAKAVDVAHTEWQKEMAKSLDERLAPLVTRHEVMLETLRSVVTLLTDVEGVVPLDAVTEQPAADDEGDAAAADDEGEDITTVADLRSAYPDLVKEIEDAAKAEVTDKAAAKAAEAVIEPEKKAVVVEPAAVKKEELVPEVEKIKTEKAAVEAELAALKELRAKELQTKAIAESVAAVLARDDFKRVEKLLHDELSGEKPTLLIESADKVEEVLTAARDRIIATMVEGERQKIVASGLTEIGTIANPDKAAPALNEQQELRFYREARSAGFVGSFAEWKQKRAIK
jgi:hypothetical protein